MQKESIHTMSIVNEDRTLSEYLLKHSQATVKDRQRAIVFVFSDFRMLPKIANRCPCSSPSEKSRCLETSILADEHAYSGADSEQLLVRQLFHYNLRCAVCRNDVLRRVISHNHPTKAQSALCVECKPAA